MKKKPRPVAGHPRDLLGGCFSLWRYFKERGWTMNRITDEMIWIAGSSAYLDGFTLEDTVKLVADAWVKQDQFQREHPE